MSEVREDQAAGLRRLFRRAPPAVVAVHATGHRSDASVLALAHRLAKGGSPVVILDEGSGLAPPESPGLDLLHALDGRVGLAALRQRLGGAVTRVPVGVAAPAFALLDQDRRQRLLMLLEELHRRASFVLVRAGGGSRPSPFSWAAPRSLVVAEASGRGATQAYTRIKDLAAAGRGGVHVAVTGARDRADAGRFFAELETLVRRHVGVPLAWEGELERDDLAASLARPLSPAIPREAEWGFLRRLNAWAGGNGLSGGMG